MRPSSPRSARACSGRPRSFPARLGATLFIRDDPVHDRVLTTLRLTLGEERFAAAREIGRGLSIEAAIAEARAIAETVFTSLILAD